MIPGSTASPAALYDRYYYPETDSPSIDNDYGGVHINCSLIGYVGYQLCAQGMSKDQAFGLWMGMLRLMTPKSGYQEVREALKFSAQIMEWEKAGKIKLTRYAGKRDIKIRKK